MHYAECHFATYHNAECHYVMSLLQSFIRLSVILLVSLCFVIFAKCHNAECHYAMSFLLSFIKLNVILLGVFLLFFIMAPISA